MLIVMARLQHEWTLKMTMMWLLKMPILPATARRRTVDERWPPTEMRCTLHTTQQKFVIGARKLATVREKVGNRASGNVPYCNRL